MRLTETPLAAAQSFLDGPAVHTGRQMWTWREVHHSAIEFARRLLPGSVVCNLCDTRLGFLVACLAAMRRGCTQILPPSAGRSELTAILRAEPNAVVVVDSAESEHAWTADALCVRWDHSQRASSASDSDLAWLQPGASERLPVRLYTSGSTGTPEPHIKTLDQLARGASILACRLDEVALGGMQSLEQIVSSVPPQHMFGLETSVMLPLVTGIPVLDRQPLLPADVQDSLSGSLRRSAWVTTPLHMRALATSGTTIPSCSLVLASTMPLSPELAAKVESLSEAPALEIYGSTETGVLAARRPAMESAWRAMDGVSLETGETGTRFWGSHFPSPQELRDRVEGDRDGFQLLGREADLIKIAGRRASLANLDRILEAMPGLSSGVFHLPASSAAAQRLVLFHEGPLDRAAVRAWLRTRMDPVFLPRDFIQVERLPRTATGKLQRPVLDDLYVAYQRAEKAE